MLLEKQTQGNAALTCIHALAPCCQFMKQLIHKGLVHLCLSSPNRTSIAITVCSKFSMLDAVGSTKQLACCWLLNHARPADPCKQWQSNSRQKHALTCLQSATMRVMTMPMRSMQIERTLASGCCKPLPVFMAMTKRRRSRLADGHSRECCTASRSADKKGTSD